MCPAVWGLMIQAFKKCQKRQISGLCYPTTFQIEFDVIETRISKSINILVLSKGNSLNSKLRYS